jgi:DNA-binding transcriptional ArsR family regulator
MSPARRSRARATVPAPRASPHASSTPAGPDADSTDHPPMSMEMLRAVAEQFRALGEPARLRLLQALREGARSVMDLAKATETSHANASKHLLVLATRGFVTRRQEGTKTVYALADDSTERFCSIMCDRVSQRAEQSLRGLRGD